MNENKILSQIQNECSALSTDSFDKIRSDIYDLSGGDRADIIYTESKTGNRFLKYTAAAAALFLPAVLAVNMYSDRNSSEQNYETVNYAVSQTVSQTVYQTSSATETVVTAVSAAETEKNNAVTEISSEQVSTVTEVPYQPVFIQVTDAERTDTENITETASSDEVPADSEEYSEPVSDVTTAADAETQPVTDVSCESFESELKLVPGYKDKLYMLKFDSDKISNRKKVYSGESNSYTVESPDAYTVYIYDVIVFGYDYFDYLSKGDFLFKSENSYTLDEILSSEEKLLTVEDLIISGLVVE